MKRGRRLLIPPALLLAGLWAIGCTTQGGDLGRQPAGSGQGGGEQHVGNADTKAQKSAADRPPTSPLYDFLGIPTDPSDLSRRYGEAYQGFAATVTACMKSAGFDHSEPVAAVPQPEEFIRSSAGQQSELARYGYGISATFRLQVERLGRSGQPPRAAPSGRTLEEQSAFNDRRGVCLEQANAAHPIPDALPAAVAEEITRVRKDIEAAPELRAVWSGWSKCMSKRGFSFNDRAAVTTSLRERAAPIDKAIESSARTSRPTGDEIRRLIDAFAPHEQLLVDNDIACSAETNLETGLRTVRYELEERYLKSNGERLALALREAKSPRGR